MSNDVAIEVSRTSGATRVLSLRLCPQGSTASRPPFVPEGSEEGTFLRWTSTPETTDLLETSVLTSVWEVSSRQPRVPTGTSVLTGENTGLRVHRRYPPLPDLLSSGPFVSP